MSNAVTDRKILPPAHVVWREGDPAYHAYVLRSGAVWIGRGETRVKFNARTIIGESALLGQQLHHDDCVVAEAAEIVKIPMANFHNDFEKTPRSVQSVCKALIWKLKLTTQLIGR